LISSILNRDRVGLEMTEGNRNTRVAGIVFKGSYIKRACM